MAVDENDDEAFRKIFRGNCIFSYEIQRKRTKLFLNRNLRKALEACQKPSEKGSKKAARPPPSVDHGKKRKISWKSSHQESESTPAVPSLLWDVRYIRRKSFDNDDLSDTNNKTRKRARYDSYKCQCVVSIWNSQDLKQLVYRDSRPCMVNLQGDPANSLVKLELSKPFDLNISNLLPPAKRRSRATHHTQKGFVLQVSFSSEMGHGKLWPPIVLNEDIDEYTAKNGFVTALFSGLPACPSEPLNLSFQSSAWNVHETGYCLDAIAAWHIGESIVPIPESSNVAHNSKGPPSVSSALGVSELAKLKLVFLNGCRRLKTFYVDGWRCPFCRNMDLKNWNLYHFHLVNWHDNFLFAFKKSHKEIREDVNRNIPLTMYVEIKSHYRYVRASNAVEDPRDINWVKPVRRFDMDAYLDGDDSWLDEGGIKDGLDGDRRIMQRADHVSGYNSETFSSDSGSKHNDGSYHYNRRNKNSKNNGTGRRERQRWVPKLEVIRPLPSKVSVEKVEDVHRHRSRVPVPEPPEGVTFISSRTFQPVKPGEYRSESDDDVNIDWLVRRQNASNPIKGRRERLFSRALNEHLTKEAPVGSVHFTDSLVRFCRLRGKLLRSKRMRSLLIRKLSEYVAKRLIDSRTIYHCVETLTLQDMELANEGEEEEEEEDDDDGEEGEEGEEVAAEEDGEEEEDEKVIDEKDGEEMEVEEPVEEGEEEEGEEEEEDDEEEEGEEGQGEEDIEEGEEEEGEEESVSSHSKEMKSMERDEGDNTTEK